jgi:hypothetical protein
VGLSASSAGRRFIEATRREAEAYQERPIEGEFLSLFTDSGGSGEYLIVVAVGIRDDGTKMVLGVRQGDTENRALCQEMLESMVTRGLRWDGRPMLVVTDGGKGIQAAARAVFGKTLVLQRCRSHRGRSITDKLPEGEREEVRRQLWRAGMTEDADQAKAPRGAGRAAGAQGLRWRGGERARRPGRYDRPQPPRGEPPLGATSGHDQRDREHVLAMQEPDPPAAEALAAW